MQVSSGNVQELRYGIPANYALAAVLRCSGKKNTAGTLPCDLENSVLFRTFALIFAGRETTHGRQSRRVCAIRHTNRSQEGRVEQPGRLRIGLGLRMLSFCWVSACGAAGK